MKKINIFTTELKLVFFSIIFLFFIKLFYVNGVSNILLTTFYDISIFGLLLSLTFFFKSFFVSCLFYIFYFLNFFIFSFYYIFFHDISQRGAVITNVSLESIIFIFKNIISPKLILVSLGGFFVIFFFSIYLYKGKKIFLKKKIILFSIFGFIFLFFILFLSNIQTNPYADILYNSINSFNYISLDGNFIPDTSLFLPDRSIKDYSKESLKYKKILVFVGEEWMFSEYFKESDLSFFKKTSNHTFSYTNYYTTNQDSRTSVFTMLSSFFIPYEAYLDSTYPLYLNSLKQKNNLVDFFNYNNYSTYFLVSSLQTTDIATPFSWKEIKTLNEDVYKSKDYYCLDIFTYETACEDLSVLKDAQNIIIENKHVFLVQEFIYGHSYRYLLDNKASRTTYYNNYFNNIYSFLEENNLLDETLIVITSDHGSRALNNMIIPDGYKVPLLFISTSLKEGTDSSLLSHLDFKDILFKFIMDKDNITENQNIMFIGGTESNLIGFKNASDDFGIINVSSSKLINYSLNNNSIKDISEKQFSFYKSLRN